MTLPSTSPRLFRRPTLPPDLRAGATVSEHRLTNGLRVLLAERHTDPVVASVLFYGAGARTETEREAGLSHFLEHMMFKGTPRHGKGEVDRLTALLGGQNNAFTSYDHTAYWFELAADRWERALELESDRMRHLSLDPTEFEAERAVVLEELAMGEDDPWRALARRVEELLFPHHPYGRPIIGYPDTLKAMRPGDLHAYRARFYCPGNATLVVAGDFQRERALAAIDEHFGALPAGRAFTEVDCFRRALEEPTGEKRVQTSWDDPARRVIVVWPTVKVGTKEDDALDIALLVLSSGRTSRLHRKLVLEQGLATSVSAANDSRVEAGAFWLYAECAQDADPAKLEAALHAEVARLAKEPITKAELARAQAMLVASEAFEAESVTDIAEELGEWATDADWRFAFDGCKSHLALTPAEIQAAVAKYLRPERRVVGWCVPKAEVAAKRARAAKTRPSTKSAKRKA
ncbi:MAG: pitrilysin family protein [Planctomycetota bacterium]